jgi:hypothetical protein
MDVAQMAPNGCRIHFLDWLVLLNVVMIMTIVMAGVEVLKPHVIGHWGNACLELVEVYGTW